MTTPTTPPFKILIFSRTTAYRHASIPAGIDRMPLLQFAVYTTAGSLVWNTTLIVAGYELGAQWHRVEAYVGEASVVIYAVLGVALLWFVARRVVRRSRPAAGEA